MTKARAAVLMEPEVLEVRELGVPETGDDDGLLRIEACGMCGTDYELYYGHIKPGDVFPGRLTDPFILGHEPLGTIERIGPEASRRWGVKVGDRVVGGPADAIGLTVTAIPPALWGGYAELMYLSPGSRVFPISPDVSTEAAVTFNAMGCGVEWAVSQPELQPGQSLVIFGPGQRGLAGLLAAKSMGAGFVALAGLSRDSFKLDLAAELGADLVVDVEKADPVEAVRHAVPEGVDAVVDVTPNATEPFVQALQMIRAGGTESRGPGGTVVIAGTKVKREVRGLTLDMIGRQRAVAKGARGASDDSVRKTIALIESGAHPMERFVTHQYPLEQSQEAIRTLAGEFPDRQAINVVILPHA